jgi:hypothetical protein
VQKFVERHDLKRKFNFQFEAMIVCQGLPDVLFAKINQARRGPFSGTDEGRKALNNLVATADFSTADGAIAFTSALMDRLTRDRRDSIGSATPLKDQLRKGCTEESVLDDVFSLAYLQPLHDQMVREGYRGIVAGRARRLIASFLSVDRPA